MKPATQYTKSGSINIAYQVYGTGPVDMVYIPGWVSNIDWMWACPELVAFFRELGKMARLILFDKRGTGLSDRIAEISTLEERMDDIRAVMDAVGSGKAILFGHSEGGSVSALFAATYPERTVSLITFGIFARRRHAPSYPWAPTDAERRKVYDMIETSWGGGNMHLESLAPSMAGNPEFMGWLANYFRSGASPSAALVLTRMNTEVDIIDILGSIKVPTLILQRTGDIDVKIEEGRFIAERIAGSQFVELPGNDHLFWAGDTESVLREIRKFVREAGPASHNERKLFTIVAWRLIGGGSESGTRERIHQYIGHYQGDTISTTGEDSITTFEGPSKAVHCFLDLFESIGGIRERLAAGIHIREGNVADSKIVSTRTRDLMQAILKSTRPGQVLVSQTVKSLLSGSGVKFTPSGSALESGGDVHPLFAIASDLAPEPARPASSRLYLPRNNSFLEEVLACIDAHLGDEDFGVEMLCEELGVSERQLQRKLKALTNKSPIRLISSVRLHRAKELLLQKGQNIAEVAYETGFSNPSYFSKSFRKEFGTSPSAFVEAHS